MEDRLLPVKELMLIAVVVSVELKNVRDEYPVALLEVPFATNIMEVE
jgi:hypothetical protein